MTASPKKQTEETPAKSSDPFDLSKLRLDQSFTENGRRQKAVDDRAGDEA